MTDDLGRWDGDVYIYNKPIELGDGIQIRQIQFTEDTELADGITREDVLHALAHPIVVSPEVPPEAPSKLPLVWAIVVVISVILMVGLFYIVVT